MRILLVHCSYREYGGEDKVFFQERDSLRARLGPDAIWEYHVSTASLSAPRILWGSIFPVQHYLKILRLIRRNRIQLVHVHNSFPLLLGAVFRAAHHAGAVVVHTLHNYRWWCVQSELYRPAVGICEQCVQTRNPWHAVQHACYRTSRMQSFWAVMLMKLFWRSAFRYIDRFIVLSAFQAQWVRDRGVSTHQVVQKANWVETAQVISPEKRKGFVFAGRLEPSKGITHLLEVWEQLSCDEVLTVIGTGSLEQSLRMKYGKHQHIRFLGACSQEDTLKEIGCAKYLIQTSTWYETFGLTIFEAMARGVPVIGYNIGTRKEWIKDGENGFLCTPETLLSTIERALKFENTVELSNNAFSFAQQFCEEALLEKQITYYQTWIDESAR